METLTVEVIKTEDDEQDLFYSLLAENSSYEEDDYVVDFDDWSR